VADRTYTADNSVNAAATIRAPAPPPRVGMQQVADRAGVALSSVSRVVSGHPDVSRVMRNRVLDAVAALGYEPDLLAQSLRRGATMTVGFVVGNIANPLFASIALGAELRLRNAGYTMLLANSIDDPTLDTTHIRLFSQRRVDGLLLSVTDESDPEMHRALLRAQRPTVLVDREVREVHASAVLTDNAGGIERAADTLIALGHRRIAIVNGNPQVRPARERANGLRRACRRAEGVSALVRPGAFTTEHGERATLALLAEARPPTAIIAGSNLILVGVLRALRRAGRSVPDDISVVTCDDVLQLDLIQPPLATISRDPQEMGDVAAELLLELIAGDGPRTVVLPTEFTARESLAPPPQR
jgi:LacI family transcriptional regulator